MSFRGTAEAVSQESITTKQESLQERCKIARAGVMDSGLADFIRAPE
jgi:hypothetical protein